VRDFVALVSGVPRSGTSLMMQMLAAGGFPVLADAARPPDADNPRGYLEYAPVAATPRDVAWLGDARGRAVKVVHTLLRHLPEGPQLRVVLMLRDLGEVARSQRAMLARRGEPEAGEDLTPVWEAQLRGVRAWAVERPHTALLALDYRQVVSDARAAGRRVDAFLGGVLGPEAMAACVDPALYRNRAPGRGA